jgi:hypothetical protein
MSGEAEETLSMLLCDITGMIYTSVTQREPLPGFLVHESPRETIWAK